MNNPATTSASPALQCDVLVAGAGSAWTPRRVNIRDVEVSAS
jgi:hypothetical protein